MDQLLHKAESAFKEVFEGLGGGREENQEEQQQQQQQQQQQEHRYDEDRPQASGAQVGDHPFETVDTNHRFQSFAPQTTGGAKWYVDGASYFHAVSIALEEARESVYILDWWLSPELYLRRPPSRNEQYRLDNMLRAAAERGVEVRVIVYKEVKQALSCDSAHTKHALEALHPNIKVFRHPDHMPTDKSRLEQAFEGLSLDNLRMNAFSLSKVSGDALKELYGSFGDTVLYWAHHEKLCVVDRRIAFMGGLDLCFGRWDTNSHPIADVHPGNLDAIIFPGQDFNNARILDFEGVDSWDHNKLDRTKNARMGWSDVSLSLNGPIVSNLVEHFKDRWNFIFQDKYTKKDEGKYQPVSGSRSIEQQYEQPGYEQPHEERRHHFGGFQDRFNDGLRRFVGDGEGYDDGRRDRGEFGDEYGSGRSGGSGSVNIQLCRSACEWSSGHPPEHSIANAYINAIESAQHFIYIENQFFITATGDQQEPVKNKIGASIVSRIVRAHHNGENFRVIVVIPAVPAFPGDLHSNGALGTRAIMEFQYFSINRGGHSIIERLKEEGVEDWRRYIGFYNLRTYDRLNISSTMGEVERESGVRYEGARRQYEDMANREDEGGYGYRNEARGGDGDEYGNRYEDQNRDQYDRYQAAASNVQDRTWDTVSSCYMEGGPDLREVPWYGSEEAEMNAFVSEELYVHTKVLIADDKLVICGSANLNDRSQLGTHDSEIAVVIEDPEPVETTMDGRPFTASRFATSLRRQLYRKHLGLLPDQLWDRPDPNWTPVDRDPQQYDWGSQSDRQVEDPVSDEFWQLWTDRARSNTEIFTKVFHPVPNDNVRTWEQYEDFFSRHFVIPTGDEKDDAKAEEERGSKVDYGHVVREEFEQGGVAEVKDWLSRVRGTLVEMPLDFLADVKDIAKEGLTLNTFTDEIYT
ncbi:phospholipase D/nuclease [Biscogniauxia mediterranea]|nr:phospholipase D/nuclease [Biscogniauxia mediterranea]